MIPWTLTGTEPQKAIIREAFNRIKFPFERLNLPGTPELGWRDLNGSDDWWINGAEVSLGRRHEGKHAPERTDRPEPLNGTVEGRKWIMGVFFPVSARVYIDVALEDYPDLAMAVVGAEIAHAVDEFLPMTDAQRIAIMALWHPDGQDGHTWWEKVDYNAEYYTLGGEAFMHEFVNAYSDLDFGDKSAFGHHDAGCNPEDIWRILGIRRTDEALYVRYGFSTVYHKPTHRIRTKLPPTPVTADLFVRARPCLVCKP
jgi:hypothetical protein